MATRLGLFGTPFSDGEPTLFVLSFEETIGVTESVYANPSSWYLFFNESVGVADTRSRVLNKSVAEGVTTSEGRTRHPHRGISELVTVATKTQLPNNYRERFTLSDGILYGLDASRNFEEDISLSVSLEKQPHKSFEVDVTFDETYVRQFHKNVEENFLVNDTLLRATNGVVFDFYIRDDAMEFTDFEEAADSPPVGYTPFQIFYPGDYQYTEAMVGVRITGAQNGGQAGILGLTHNVDVVDITDRGQATVTALEVSGSGGEHAVTFAKTFTTTPEVTVSWAYGPDAAIAEIISVTETGFVFILRDISSPTTKVEGTATWAAIGY